MGAHPSKAGQSDARVILDCFRQIVQALRLFDREAERRAGLSGAQVFVLQKLRDGQPVSIGQLAERTHTHQSSVSVVARKLAIRRLISRKSSHCDARRTELSITPRGAELLQRLPASAQDRLLHTVLRLSSSSRRQLAELMTQLAANAGQSSDAPPLFFEDEPDGIRPASAPAQVPARTPKRAPKGAPGRVNVRRSGPARLAAASSRGRTRNSR